jgi:hypothetical protein
MGERPTKLRSREAGRETRALVLRRLIKGDASRATLHDDLGARANARDVDTAITSLRRDELVEIVGGVQRTWRITDAGRAWLSAAMVATQ